MASEWHETTVGCAFEINPPRPLKRGTITPFISMDLLPVNARAAERIDSREYTGSGMRFRNGDTLIARITPCLENGKTAFVSGLVNDEIAHGSTEYIVLAGKKEQTNSLFGYYLARTPDFRSYAINHMEGTSGRQRVPASAIEAYKLLLPPIEEQRAIAHILGTLDDKIELNRKQNKTLEAMARAMFKAWFVDFEPVRAKLQGHWQRGQSLPGLPAHLYDLFPDRLVESELGEIPEGWEIRRVSDFLSLAYGKSLPAKARSPGNVPVYGSGGITGVHNVALIDSEAVIVGRKGTVGSLYWEQSPSYPIDTVFYVQPLVSLPFCYHLLESLPLRDMNTDAAVPGLNRKNVYRLEVVSPPEVLLEKFSVLARKLREKIFTAQNELHLLTQLHDTLLPKLIAGELRIVDAEKFMERTGI